MPWLTIIDTLRGYGIPCEQNFYPKNFKFGLDFGYTSWYNMDSQGWHGRNATRRTAPILKMLSVEHVRIAWWKNSEQRTLRTRTATYSRRNGKTTERTRGKIFLTMDTQRATICTVNERKGVIPLRTKDWWWRDGIPQNIIGFFENWIAEKCEWWTYCMRSINSHHTKKRKSSGKAVATWQWRYTLRSHESSLRYTAGLSSGQSHRMCAYNV